MNKFKILIFVPLLTGILFAQSSINDDSAGNPSNISSGILNGNRVISTFQNNTDLKTSANRGNGATIWPSDEMAKQISGDTRFLVGAKVYLDSEGNPIENISNVGDASETLYFLESGSGNGAKGFAPVAEYGVDGVSPAINNDPNTWPASWPAVDWTASEKLWNGRRGKGYNNADLETFFVTNDASNMENHDKYQPISSKTDWGGLGLRCEQRGYQWKKYPMDNTIIWEYSVTNISDYVQPDIFFGLMRDNSIGGSEYSDGELIYCDPATDFIYEWDVNFLPNERPDYPGIVGIAITLTPGMDDDGIDNDGDGLVDEKNDNPAGALVKGYGLVDDISSFLEYFDYDSLWGEGNYFEGDEDRDWKDGKDLNENGIYDFGFDTPGDDLGKDGIGPYDLGYDGPDEGEGNHMPDLGEPNFGQVDTDESDQVLLNSISFMNSWTFDRNYGLDNDQKLVEYLESIGKKTSQNTTGDNIQLIATNSFSFPVAKTTGFAFAEIQSLDPLAGLSTSGDMNTPDMLYRKIVLDKVARRDNQYAKDPITPILTASVGDSKITLVWDDISRQFSTDPFADDINDFEGYKIYRATDKEMKDAMKVTDGYGNPYKYRSIAQFDIVNGRLQYINYGSDRGSGYYLGNDIGIKNFFIDKSVQNGIKYYYVVVAYDRGIEKLGDGIAPSETGFILDENTLSTNVIAVTPRTQSAGYISAKLQINERNTLGTGDIDPVIFVDSEIKPGHKYKVVFGVENGPAGASSEYVPAASIYRTDELRIYDVTERDSTGEGVEVYYENNTKYNGQNFNFDRYDDRTWNHFEGGNPTGWVVLETDMTLETAVFDGLKLFFSVPNQTPELDNAKTGWSPGSAPVNLIITPGAFSKFMAFDYDIVFTDNDSVYKTFSNPTSVQNIQKEPMNNILFDQSFNFYILNQSVRDSLGRPDTMDIVAWDKNQNGEFDFQGDAIMAAKTLFSKRGGWKWKNSTLAFIIDFNYVEGEGHEPQPGDIYQIRYERPFWEGDSLTFSVEGFQEEVADRIDDNMENIKVVPNPYVFTNIAEPAGEAGNWERRMMFTHLPGRCTIKIFTFTGLFVDEIIVDDSHRSNMVNGNVQDNGNGIAYWNLTNKDGKPVAPGYYLYRIKSEVTGKTVMDKFAIIK